MWWDGSHIVIVVLWVIYIFDAQHCGLVDDDTHKPCTLQLSFKLELRNDDNANGLILIAYNMQYLLIAHILFKMVHLYTSHHTALPCTKNHYSYY